MFLFFERKAEIFLTDEQATAEHKSPCDKPAVKKYGRLYMTENMKIVDTTICKKASIDAQ